MWANVHALLSEVWLSCLSLCWGSQELWKTLWGNLTDSEMSTELLSLTRPQLNITSSSQTKMFYLLLLRSKNSLTSGICWSKGLKIGVMKFYTPLLPWFLQWFCNASYIYTSAKEGNFCTVSITPVSSELTSVLQLLPYMLPKIIFTGFPAPTAYQHLHIKTICWE